MNDIPRDLHATEESDALCSREFEEALLSGYLDGELTQSDEQRVRLHLDVCDHCSTLVAELDRMQAATAGSVFRFPADDQWDEAPKSALSGWSRRLGWLLLAVWITAVGAYGIWGFAHSGESLRTTLPVIAVAGGVGLLFLSVLLDRLKELPKDRYQKVKK